MKSRLDWWKQLFEQAHEMVKPKPVFNYKNYLDIPDNEVRYIEDNANDISHIGELSLEEINDFLNTRERFYNSKMSVNSSNKGAN